MAGLIIYSCHRGPAPSCLPSPGRHQAEFNNYTSTTSTPEQRKSRREHSVMHREPCACASQPARCRRVACRMSHVHGRCAHVAPAVRSSVFTSVLTGAGHAQGGASRSWRRLRQGRRNARARDGRSLGVDAEYGQHCAQRVRVLVRVVTHASAPGIIATPDSVHAGTPYTVPGTRDMGHGAHRTGVTPAGWGGHRSGGSTARQSRSTASYVHLVGRSRRRCGLLAARA